MTVAETLKIVILPEIVLFLLQGIGELPAWDVL
jgi:hypothetical protein